ncbi:signal transduction histidine kinase [Thermocatellispora tengchongensis]|uniref:histidine kinase n=1 Tax=Thermocatellispora tengchongensis TaxID=1073253 RepID=A0A840P1B7_9ACTN|nr:nitrate- and nitrite sensing domain-containing protein [Thermocatellispora tengchongensis]MBB5135054.1 signal transduction histidine kinase [Thermocatellispora tengchongensis]
MSSPPPIRTKLLRILLLPLVSMVALWGFIAYSSVEEIVTVSRAQDRWEAIGSPVLQLIVELQRERQLSAEAPRGTASYAPLAEQRRVTDAKADRLRQIIGSVDLESEGAETPEQVRALVQALDGLRTLRASADAGRLTPPLKVIDAYNNLIDVANKQFNDRDALSSVSAFQAVRGMAAYSSTAEYLGREHAIITSTIVHGKMTPADRAAFVAAFNSRRIVFANAERDVGPELRVNFAKLAGGASYKRLVEAEDLLFTWDTTGGPPPVDPEVWKSDADAMLGAISRDTQRELARAAAETEAQKTGAYWRIGLVLVLGLAAVVVSVLLSYRFGRSLIDELRRLQASAVELAEQRLPRLVERLRRGEDVDPATEAPNLDPADTAEVDRVVHAFAAVRRTAVEAAVGQATLRKGVGQVFLNLAWRNQALLHRQLALLDTMERRVEEPEVLEDLFKLDHLTTRMRRHAENLIILSDSAPARRWRDPVPLFDVVRAAVLEVEDYTRVTIAPMPNAPLLMGAAVTDVIHLVAELVENATVFSPPDTTVHIRSMTAANGFALEVEDRGLGLNQATLDELNARLAEPPEFDLADSDRLGLFVVSRLAARHGIKVVLRRSPYDGTTAIVLLPSSLLAASAETPAAAQPQRQAEHAAAARAARPMRALGTAPAEPRSGGVAVAPDPFPAPQAPGNPAPEARTGPVGLGGRGGRGGASGTHGAPGVPVRAPAPEPERGAWFDAGPAPRPAGGTATGPIPTPVPGSPVPPAAPAVEWSVTVPAQDADEDLDGLPMRIPQANMAPQLRDARRAERRSVSVRSPEELAQLMSSMQRGWQQGRRQAEQGHDVWNRKDDHPDARPQK